MTRTRIAGVLAMTFVLGSGIGLRADVKSEQKTLIQFAGMLGKMMNMFGGKAAKEGVTTTVAVKGNRKISTTQTTGTITDLDEEKVYELNLKGRSYKVTTFAEMRQKMEEARRKAEEAEKKRAEREEKATKKDSAEKEKEVEMEVDFDVKETGQKKNINGFDTKEVVMTITIREKGKTLEQGGGLVMTSDMWMAPKNAALQEIVDFDMKYHQKLNGPMFAGASADEMAAAMAMYKGFSKGTEKMRTEGAKVSGTAIQTTITADSVQSAEQMARQQSDEKKDDERSGGGGMGGLMGGFAKKLAQKKSSDDSAAGPPKARTTFMTTTTEVLKISTDVAAADLAIPAGFQQK